jgi:curved DNA-binding protein
MSDHYQTLGVGRDASQDDIKKAYRKMAAQHHPDRGGDTAKFQEVQAAYETLGDPGKRQQYDNPQSQGFPGGGFHFTTSGFPPGFEDIFAHFGGGSPFGNMFNQHRPQRNHTLNLQTTITLEEAFEGKDLVANVGLPSGRDQTIEVKIPAGVLDGTVLRLSGMGDDTISGIPRGDIHLTVSIAPHHKFQRHGDDLHYKVQVSCVDAMLGKKINVETIDGKTLELTIQPGTQHGQTLAAAGYGMPKMNDNRFKGRMMIFVDIVIPKDLTARQKQLLSQAFP